MFNYFMKQEIYRKINYSYDCILASTLNLSRQAVNLPYGLLFYQLVEDNEGCNKRKKKPRCKLRI